MQTTAGPVMIQTGQDFRAGSSGRWAGEQIMKALKSGATEFDAASLFRTLDTLRKDEWKFFDEQLVQEAVIRLRGVGDLIARGLTRTVPNSLGKTVFEYEKVSDMDPAIVSLDGKTRSDADRQTFTLDNAPLPLIHKDFFINLRTLIASRNRGESLDATQVRTAGRLVSEASENLLFNGGKVFGGASIYGYLNHPNRNTVGFGSGVAWSAAGKTGAQIIADALTLIGMAETDRMFGPYMLYVSRNINTKLSNDYDASFSSRTIRQRLLEIDGIEGVGVSDQMPSDNVALVQMTSDVVTWVQGEQLQTIQWDVEGGFQVNFKAFQIAVPLVRADASGRSGVQHMS